MHHPEEPEPAPTQQTAHDAFVFADDAVRARASEGLADVVAARVAAAVADLRAAEATLRADRAPESLHALRVVLRRLRSLVRAFRDLWPQAAVDLAQAQLAETSRRCGEVRDLDVGLAALREQAEELPEPLRAGAGAALAWAEAERVAAARRLHEWLDADDRLAAQSACEAALAAIDTAAPAASLASAAEVALRVGDAAQRLRKRIRAIDADLPTPDVHELRIAGKRLRYLLEAFADGPFPVRPKALSRLVRVQQAIGHVCDHENALARLLVWLRPAMAAADDAALVAAAIGALAAQHGRAARKARKAAKAAIAKIDRKGFWRALGIDGEPADANLAS